MPVYSTLVADANDRVGAEDFVDMSSLFLVAFGGDALLGPPAIGGLSERFGPASAFLAMAAIHAALEVAAAVVLLRGAAVSCGDRVSFVPQTPIGT